MRLYYFLPIIMFHVQFTNIFKFFYILLYKVLSPKQFSFNECIHISNNICLKTLNEISFGLIHFRKVHDTHK